MRFTEMLELILGGIVIGFGAILGLIIYTFMVALPFVCIFGGAYLLISLFVN